MSNGIERYRLPLLVPGFAMIGATMAPGNRECSGKPG